MFELSKRKGGPSALRLVALLSLVLGACASRQQGSARREGDSRLDADPPIAATITTSDDNKTVVIAPGGTLTATNTNSNVSASYLCFCRGSAAARPFTTEETCIPVNSGDSRTVKSKNATYTWKFNNSDGVMCPPLDLEGVSGTLQVGTGVGTEEEPAAR